MGDSLPDAKVGRCGAEGCLRRATSRVHEALYEDFSRPPAGWDPSVSREPLGYAVMVAVCDEHRAAWDAVGAEYQRCVAAERQREAEAARQRVAEARAELEAAEAVLAGYDDPEALAARLREAGGRY